MKTLLNAALFSLTLIWLHCSKAPTGPQVTGTGSNEGNAFAGIVTTSGRGPAAGAVVRVYAADAIPVAGAPDSSAAAMALTDSLGSFHIGGLPNGAYNIEFRLSSDTAALIRNKTIDNAADQAVCCDAILSPTGTITNVEIDSAAPDSAGIKIKFLPEVYYKGIAYIAGTSIIDSLDRDGGFKLRDVPAGTHRVSMFFNRLGGTGTSSPVTRDTNTTVPDPPPTPTCGGVSDSVTVVEGGTAFIDSIPEACRRISQ